MDVFGWNGAFIVMIGGCMLAILPLLLTMLSERRHHAILEANRLAEQGCNC